MSRLKNTFQDTMSYPSLWMPIIMKTLLNSPIQVVVMSTQTPTLSRVDKDRSSVEKMYVVFIAEESYQLTTTQ